jgi:MoxR-like ATPase
MAYHQPMESSPDVERYRDQIRRFRETHERIRAQVRRVIVGQEETVEQLLLTLWAGGHCLITGLPGTAKTLLVRTLASALALGFKRIQFTPDLMPTDITGTDILEEDAATGHRRWTFSAGPIFTHVLLADEVNRTPPKTQAALLEAMQEGSCTVRGTTYPLERPFFVLATQNPIELEGTYPLPEAQLDRFLLNVVLDYLSAADEVTVVARNTSEEPAVVETCTNAEEILTFRGLVKKVLLSDSAARYAVLLLRATRPAEASAPEVVKKYVKYGTSVRATQFLVLAAKARALTHGRYHVSIEDIQALVLPVLRHRLLTNFHAESDGINADEILRQLVAGFRAPSD